ncbi:MAG TPA: alpha/beta fold hydrolase [Polyangia bacterium]|jgi:hypothetical protein
MTRPLLLFAPGAGAPSSSPWMLGWRARLATLGEVVTLDYPYMLAGRRAPDPLPRLVAAHQQALAAARAEWPGPVVLIGKSMGGRVGCHVAAEEDVAAVVCLGYPLRGARGAVRDEALLALRCPVLFVQGRRDPLCPIELFEGVRARMTARSELRIVEDGNHSLEVPRRALQARGETQEQVDARTLGWIREFLAAAPGRG